MKMQQNLLSNGSGQNEDAFYEIMTLPMPSKNDELFEQMDIWTAASLDGLRPDTNPQLQLTSKELSCDNHAGWTPLMYAAYLGHLKSTQHFLDLNADLEQQNALGQTALMLAASCGNEDMLKLLLEHTKSRNAKDKLGQTALHYASLYGQGRLANLLLQFGYDANAEDNEKMTPTLIACASGQLDVLSQMLKNNGDPERKNCRGENGEQIAIANKQRQVVDQLHKHRKVVEKHRETADLKAKFMSNDLEKYWDIFVQNNFTTFAVFSKLTAQELDDMEIKLLGPRKKLQGMILAIKQQMSAQPTTSTANRHLRPDSAVAENARLNQRAPSPSAAPPIPNRDGTPIDYRRLYHDSSAKLEANERKIEVMKVLLSEQMQLNSAMCQHLKSFARQAPSIAAVRQLIVELDKANQRISPAIQN
ncbi:ANK-REP-REGION domain-containing protein [Aphelenchoides besseyi]|nr:ANK-REP-REGION domain-containing protein [Aphelenchoides besseyi]